jgi:predicted ATP-dependent serine protease
MSSKLWKALSKKTIFIWEISLTGKVKKVMFLDRRVKEAVKMWFTEIYIPDSGGKLTSLLPKGGIIEVKNIKDFIKNYS